MTPEMMKMSQIMRLVALAVFIWWLLQDMSWVRVFFACLCGLFFLVTAWQLKKGWQLQPGHTDGVQNRQDSGRGER